MPELPNNAVAEPVIDSLPERRIKPWSPASGKKPLVKRSWLLLLGVCRLRGKVQRESWSSERTLWCSIVSP